MKFLIWFLYDMHIQFDLVAPIPPGTWRKMVKLISLLDTVTKYMYM